MRAHCSPSRFPSNLMSSAICAAACGPLNPHTSCRGRAMRASEGHGCVCEGHDCDARMPSVAMHGRQYLGCRTKGLEVYPCVINHRSITSKTFKLSLATIQEVSRTSASSFRGRTCERHETRTRTSSSQPPDESTSLRNTTSDNTQGGRKGACSFAAPSATSLNVTARSLVTCDS